MAKRTISFKNYEEPGWEDYTGEDPPPNKWFTAKATKAKYLEEDDQLQVIFEITEGDYQGWGKGFYVPLDENSEVYWKTHQLIKALQGGVKKDVTVDWANERQVAAWIAKQKPVKIKTRLYNDNITINKVAPLLEAVPAAAKAAPEPEPEDDDADEALEDYTAEELEAMEAGDLEEILTEEFEADLPKKLRNAAAYKKKLIEAILEAQDEDGDEDDDEEESEEDEEFEDGFEEDEEEEEEEPEPAKPARRSRAAKTAPAKAAPAKATTTRRRRS